MNSLLLILVALSTWPLGHVQAFSPSITAHFRPPRLATSTHRNVVTTDQVAAFEHDDPTRTFFLKKNSEKDCIPYDTSDQLHELPTALTSQQLPQHRVDTTASEGEVATVRLLRGLVDAMYPPAEAALERRLTVLVEEAVERSAERQAGRLVWRRCMAVLPLCGAAFALYLAQHDIHRAQHEWKDHGRIHLLRQTASPASMLLFPSPATVIATCLFLVAGVADILDAIIHMYISYDMLTMMDPGTLHSTMHALPEVATTGAAAVAPVATDTDATLAVVMEELSSTCVVTSAVSVALGECVSFVNGD